MRKENIDITLTPLESILAARIDFDEEVLRLVKGALGKTIEPYDQSGGIIDNSLRPVWADEETNGKGFTVRLADACYIDRKSRIVRHADGYFDAYIDTWYLDELYKIRGLLPNGYLAFLTEDWAYRPGVSILKTSDPYEIIRVRQTQGWSFDNRNYWIEDIIQVLVRWEEQCRLDLIGSDSSDVKLVLKTLPDDLSGFAEEVNYLCPDLYQINGFGYIGDGLEEVRIVAEKLAASLRETRRLYLWWD